MHSDSHEQLDRNGFVLLRRVYSDREIRGVIDELSAALDADSESSPSIRSRGGRIYACRNLLHLFPRAQGIWDSEPLRRVLGDTLGTDCGLVRGLYFDKPPDQSWSLPWHKDVTIAVQNSSPASRRVASARMKAGVPHVEAPRCVLESMLTLRIHLDDVTEENGPLLVIPGSHRCDEGSREREAIPIYATAGDVLAMRPLLSHSSRNSRAETSRHRRIIHLEFAATPELPDGLQWHYFQPVNPPNTEAIVEVG